MPLDAAAVLDTGRTPGDCRPTTAIVFSVDQTYLPLAQGLVRSLNANVTPFHAVEVVCVDIGLQEDGRDWMAGQGVRVVAVREDLLPPSVLAAIADAPHMIAMAGRPYFPELLPEYDVFVHLDADTWVQNDEFFLSFMQCVAEAPEKIVLAPGQSHYGTGFYGRIDKIIEVNENWVFGLYDILTARALSKSVFFSAGVFAMHRSSPVWKLWADELARIYVVGKALNPQCMHLHEQTALNGVVRTHALVEPVDPLFNFHCNDGGAIRCPKTGRVITCLLRPHREISVVHLAGWSQFADFYTTNRLIYEG
jgi:hypothetical protein